MEPTEEEEGGTTAHHPGSGAVGEKLRKVTVVLRRCDQEEEEGEQDDKRLGKGKSCQKYGENTLRIVPLSMAFVTGFSKPVRQGSFFPPRSMWTLFKKLF